MRILFLSQVLPYPLDAGPKMRSYYVLRRLVQKHEVTLLTFVRDTDRPEHIQHLAEFCPTVHTVPIHRGRVRDARFLGQSLLTHQPFLIIRDRNPAMIDKIHRLIDAEAFDAIHADQLWMAQYALEVLQSAAHTPPKLVLDQHNAVHLIPKRLANDGANPILRKFLDREARLLMTYEADVCRRFDQVVWVTKEDRQAVASLYPPTDNGHLQSPVIPICADPQRTEPVAQNPNRRRLTFLGGLHWPPNAQGITWFAKNVFPQIRAEIPDAVLTVIGKSPPAGIEGPGIELTGYVNDLRPYLSETAVFIVPLHAGGGMRVKILDAWSWGLPIVSTSIGAEGIAIRPEQDILIADTVPAFAQAVLRIMKDPALAQRIGQNGRRTVLEKYDWQKIYRAWDELYYRLDHSETIETQAGII